MATVNNIGLYQGYNAGTYSDANVIALLSDYQNDIYVNGNITATGNVSGNIVVANSFVWGNGINLVNTLYSNVNVASYLPTYAGYVGGQVTNPTQPFIRAVGPLVNLVAASNVNAANNYINNVATPLQGGDAANKAYVDSVVQGLAVKAAVTVATTTQLPAYTYDNGPYNDGVGATITSIANGALTIDGIVLPINARVLVKNELTVNSPYNGIYTVSRQGPGSTWQLRRATDMDIANDFYGAYAYVSQGSINGTTSWICTNDCAIQPIIVGITPIEFTQFASTGLYTAGNALAINASVISVNTDGTSILVNGSNQLALNPATSFTNPNIGNAIGNTLALTNGMTASRVSASGNIYGADISASGTITGAINPVGAVTASQFNGNLVGNVTGASRGNITTNAILASGTGNIITITGAVSATGNIGTAGYIFGNGALLSGITVNYSNANVSAFLPTYSGQLQCTALLNVNSSGVGNVASVSRPFNTVHATEFIGSSVSANTFIGNTFSGTAVQALYADLAEMYLADQPLTPGTVVEIGGPAEVRATTSRQTTAVAGVISTQPSYLMNSACQGEFPVAVALTGRCPCRVVGTIHKGDLLVSSAIEGVATSATNPPAGTIIGKALGDYDSFTVGTIEVLVGRV